MPRCSQREQRPCGEMVRPERSREIPARRGYAQMCKREPVLDKEARRAGEPPLEPGRCLERHSTEPLVLVDRGGPRLLLAVGHERPTTRHKKACTRAGSRRQLVDAR